MTIYRRMLKRTQSARLLLTAAFATSLSGTASTATELPLNDITPTSVQRYLESAITDETNGFRYADPPEALSPVELRSELLELETGEQSEVVYYQRGGRAWVLLQGYNAASILCQLGEDRTLRSCYIIESRHVGPSCRPVTEISSRILIECDLILGTGTGRKLIFSYGAFLA